MAAAGRISRKIKQGKVEIDYEDYALLVNYDLEMVQLDDNGMLMGVLERKPEVRRIKIKSLSADKNMAQLAADIVDKCKYIHPSRAEELEQLLIKMRKHSQQQEKQQEKQEEKQGPPQRPGSREDEPDARAEARSKARGSTRGGRDEDRDDRESGRDRDRERERERERRPQEPQLPPAEMGSLDDYLDMLYQVSGKSTKEQEDGLKVQERGTAMILQLCRDVMNLEQLIQNSTVMGALTRVLQEEYKKSVELTFNILRVFLAFSNFTEMHSLMANYRVGVLTMKALDFEIKRSEVRESERAGKEAEWGALLAEARGDSAVYASVLESVKRKREKETVKNRATTRKQDKLLFVGFYILLNLAEDLGVERKMVKKQLLPSLAFALHRKFEDLLILCVTFLKKLCTIGENKDAVKELGLLDSLMRFVPCSSQPLITITLRLLFNLSFDQEMREYMLKGGMVPKLVNLLKTPVFRAKTLKLLYHLSVDDRCKSMITYTDGVPILMGLVINFPQQTLAKELAALVVNISYNPRNAELMIGNKGLNLLMDRLADKRDPLLLKIVRNISHWTFNQQEELESPEMQYKYRGLWSPHIKVLMEIILEEDSHDMLVEVFGTLANMTIYDLPASSNWAKLLREYNLINLFCKMLVPGMAQNDLLLEIVMLVSTIASDMQACDLIASSTLVGLLYQLWEEKGDDAELLLQLVHCFHKLFMHDAAREEAMYSTRIVADLMECLGHRSAAIRAKAAQMCEIVLEYDRSKEGQVGNLGTKILQKKFESYNRKWVAGMQDLHFEQQQQGYDEYHGHFQDNAAQGRDRDDQNRFFDDKSSAVEWPHDEQGSFAHMNTSNMNTHSDEYSGSYK